MESNLSGNFNVILLTGFILILVAGLVTKKFKVVKPPKVFDVSDLEIGTTGEEALSWLKANKNKYPLAGNRFDSKAQAVSFIKNLYQLGAVKVEIGAPLYDEAWRIREDGGPYAESLVVTLPESIAQRKAIGKIYFKEMQDEGLLDEAPDPDDYPRDEVIRFWWD